MPPRAGAAGAQALAARPTSPTVAAALRRSMSRRRIVSLVILKTPLPTTSMLACPRMPIRLPPSYRRWPLGHTTRSCEPRISVTLRPHLAHALRGIRYPSVFELRPRRKSSTGLPEGFFEPSAPPPDSTPPDGLPTHGASAELTSAYSHQNTNVGRARPGPHPGSQKIVITRRRMRTGRSLILASSVVTCRPCRALSREAATRLQEPWPRRLTLHS